MQISVTARVENKPMKELVKKHKPILKARLNTLFLQQTYQTLTAPGGRILLERQANEAVRQEILALEGDPDAIRVVFDDLTLN